MTTPPRYVIDASIAVKWLFSEVGSESALALLDRADTDLVTLLAPDVFAAEVTNVIWKRARLLHQLSDEARAFLGRMRRTLPELVESRELLAQALELALAFRVPVYDSLYAALHCGTAPPSSRQIVG